MKLSLLICSLESRKPYLDRLLEIIEFQSKEYKKDIEVVYEIDKGEKSIGAKRNILLNKAQGEYIAFIDDDDRISWDYVPKILKAIESKPDCCSLTGVITFNGRNPQKFIHSTTYTAYFDKVNEHGQKVYYRFPNHLNAIKRSIAIQFKFPETNHGEDTDFAVQVFKSGLIKTEVHIDGIIYNYDYLENK